MGIHLKVVNFDQLFATSQITPEIVNNIDVRSQAGLERLNQLIYTTYTDNSLELLPTCHCGILKGECNVGTKCSNCNTVCASVTERPLESLLWIAAPKGIHALINPTIWYILERYLYDGGVNVLEWLTNSKMVIGHSNIPPTIRKLKHLEVPRGLNYFYTHFDDIMDLLINKKVSTRKSLADRKELLEFITENRDCVFCKALPIPSKIAIIIEKTPMGAYADSTSSSVIEAIRTISDIGHSATRSNLAIIEAKTIKAIKQITHYYINFIKGNLSSKTGWFRKHLFGSRTHFSFRGVVSSITEPHDYRDIELPWSMSCMFFKMHLINKLKKMGYSALEANNYIMRNTLRYDPLLDQLFKEIIHEGVDNRVHILLNRNPTLTRGSIQKLRVSKVSTDPNINTIRLSVLILKAFNCDFDGDALNGLLLLSNDVIERSKRLEPHLYTLDVNSPRKISGFLALPAPIMSTIGNWINNGKT